MNFESSPAFSWKNREKPATWIHTTDVEEAVGDMSAIKREAESDNQIPGETQGKLIRWFLEQETRATGPRMEGKVMQRNSETTSGGLGDAF